MGKVLIRLVITPGFYGFSKATDLENRLACLDLHISSERFQTLDIRSSQGKVPLDVRTIPFKQSTPEIRTKVHVLRGFSLSVVTLEFIVRELSKKSTEVLSC